MTIQINIWAVLVCSVVNLGLGALWYSPLLFAGPWSKLAGTKMDQGGSALPLYLGSYFAGLVLAAILAVVISIAGVQTVWEGLILAAVVWIGFTAAPAFANTIFEGRPFALWGINVAYPAVSALLQSVILVLWR